MTADAAVQPVAGVDVASQTLWERMDKRDLARTMLVGVSTILVLIAGHAGIARLPMGVFSVLVLVIGCWEMLVEAWDDLRKPRMSMELSMLLAIIAAAAIGEWVSALAITTFALAAEILEDLSMDRGRDALTDLMAFLPARVLVRRTADTGPGRARSADEAGAPRDVVEEAVQEIPLEDVVVGDLVVVEPGGRIPVDGVVENGSAGVDQSRLTGESLPVDVGRGDHVLAGSIAVSGALEIRVERVGEDSAFGQIIATVREAQDSRAPVQRLADRLAGALVLFAIAAAILTFVVTRDARATISVVIVAGACGIAAGTPLAILASIARAAHTGAFVKDGTHLEVLSRVDTVVFDKTGTLTAGRAEVVSVHPAPGHDENEVLEAAATAEWHSEHPLGRAIVALANQRALTPGEARDVVHTPGLGVSALVEGRRVEVGNARLVPGGREVEAPGGTTQVLVAIDAEWVGTIVLGDSVRDSASACVDSLLGMGISVLMLTGDNEATAHAIAEQTHVGDVRSGLLPTDKHTVIGQLRAEGHVVAMVGDGVNDAPALAAADVGIAVGSGTDVARESADVVLVTSDLMDLTRTVQVARSARRTIMANFVGTLIVDGIGMVLAATGVLGPVAAALVHVTSESVFILNSARLIPRRRSSEESPSRT